MSIMGDFGPFSEGVLFSGDTEYLFEYSLTLRCESVRSLFDPIVEDRDLEPSESLSDVSLGDVS